MTKKVMIIDDQYRNLLLLEQILEDMFEDIDIVKADSGEKAIAAARDKEFDLILTDISLPMRIISYTQPAADWMCSKWR